MAARQKEGARQFILGNAVGLAPMAALGFFMPWWRFLEFHAGRGLEVESLWAAALWFGHFYAPIDVHWTWVKAWEEVTGGAAARWLVWARLVWAGTVLLGVGASGWRAWSRKREALDLAWLAQLLLIALLPFVAFNIVLSPQYMIWLLSLAAVTACGSEKKLAWILLIATALTPAWYPSPEFGSGLTRFQTTALLGRDGLLIVAWWTAWQESGAKPA